LLVWVGLTLFFALAYFMHPNSFTPYKISIAIQKYGNWSFFVFWAVSMLRGLTCIPSTPFVIAGTLLFPNASLSVFIISLSGIAFSSTLIYYLSDYLGFAGVFQTKYPHKIQLIRQKLQSPAGLLFVFIWSMFPFVPTDLICYAAGTAKISFPKIMLSLLAGEAVIVAIYVYSIKLI
jgi:uncharacterized membrane protein YdjX (TVP38/TMEM64 family)